MYSLEEISNFLTDSVESFIELDGFKESKNWGINYLLPDDDEQNNFEARCSEVLICMMHLHNRLVSIYLAEVKRLANAGEIELSKYVVTKNDKRLKD